MGLSQLIKHLPGKHDQNSHGRRGVEFASITLAEVSKFPAIYNDPKLLPDMSEQFAVYAAKNLPLDEQLVSKESLLRQAGITTPACVEAPWRELKAAAVVELGPIARDMQKAWANTVGNGGIQDELQAVVKLRTGAGRETSGMAKLTRPPSEEVNQYYDAMKARTAAFLRSQGYGPESLLTVYRGVRVGRANADSANPLSSWSSDPAAAADYALYNPEPATVLAMRVKAKYVFAMGFTGLGNPNSSEVIVEAPGVSNVHKILG